MTRLLRTMAGDKVLLEVRGKRICNRGGRRRDKTIAYHDLPMTPCSNHEACHGGDFEPADAAKHFERPGIPAIGEVLPDGPANHVQLAIAPGIINAGSFPGYLGGIALRKHGGDGACRGGVSYAHFSGD